MLFFDKDMLENVRLGLEGLCFGISFEKVWDCLSSNENLAEKS